MTDPFDTVRAAFRLPPEGHHRLCNSRLNPVGPESQCDCFMRRYQPALAALAEIEKRLREARKELGDALYAMRERAEKAEAERDAAEAALNRGVEEAVGKLSRAHVRALEQRVAELEAALREIADDEEPNHYRRLQGIARRALEGA